MKRFFKSRRFRKIISCHLCLILALALAIPVACATIAASGIDDGYAGKVLDKIMKNWPQSLEGVNNARFQIVIDANGQYVDCRASQSSGQGATDKAICAAIKRASPYGTPPYAQPAEVSLALRNSGAASGQAKLPAIQEAPKQPAVAKAAVYSESQKKYLEKITRELRNSVYIPQQSKPGIYYPSVRITLAKDGKITDYKIIKSSGDKTMDKYLLQGVKRAGKVSPPPQGLDKNVDLTFRLAR